MAMKHFAAGFYNACGIGNPCYAWYSIFARNNCSVNKHTATSLYNAAGNWNRKSHFRAYCIANYNFALLKFKNIFSFLYYTNLKNYIRTACTQQFLVNVPAIIISWERMPHTKPQRLKEKMQINEDNFYMSFLTGSKRIRNPE
jgi:hypothetical protein